MGKRHEEKYLIDYRQYALLKNRAARVLAPDPHGESYTVTSLYFDDPVDSALLEKQDGLALHTKFRLRTYDCREDFVRLERKDKQGIITQKQSAQILCSQLPLLEQPSEVCLSGVAGELMLQMAAGSLRPAVTVRYRRDAFLFPGTDLRLTFDTCLEALAPEMNALFAMDAPAIPILDRNTVIMEIKYGRCVPAFIRTLTGVPCKQLSVSKYALCREGTR